MPSVDFIVLRKAALVHASGCTSLAEEELVECIIGMLRGKAQVNELANDLLELLGFDHFDLVSELVSRRSQLVDSWESHLIAKAASSSVPGPRVQVRLASEVKAQKEGERLARKRGVVLSAVSNQKQMTGVGIGLSEDDLRRVLASGLQSFGSGDVNMLPGVYKRTGGSTSLSALGMRTALPAGTEREDNVRWESFTLPFSAGGPHPRADSIEPVLISDLDDYSRRAFPAPYKSLNRMQSAVFPIAHGSQENMLVCAPTGAGKTDVAMLTVLRCLLDHRHAPKDSFKIVYVAPMKALASEVAAKFGSRLRPFGIAVREYTGDMQLTRAEVAATQMLVTTPEKWDVVTRKGAGDVALVEAVRLLILDEVHLLQDERGPVLEALVARTLRAVELAQRPVRIVGLSATLPNYVDVALFLRVNLQVGLFYFDDAFRPVPLTQTLIGIKGRSEQAAREGLDKECYSRAAAFLRDGYQVMVFVHSRNETVATGRTLIRLSREEDGPAGAELFLPSEEARETAAYQKCAVSFSRECRSRELADLFRSGVAVHHAGLPRSDRNMVEAAFGAGHVRLLVCTATLAWGVNLPAHAVIIKGTQLWDPARGGPVRLGVLDVLQIFGRAGRPQYETHGEAILLTKHTDLPHYLSALLAQTPIESRLGARLVDALNAEVALGTVGSISEAVRWLGYSYLRIRMARNPTAYGLTPRHLAADPNLDVELSRLASEAAKSLRAAGMVIYDEATGRIAPRDVGRIASLFYLTCGTVEALGRALGSPGVNESSILAAISQAQEFEQLRVRQDELDEVAALFDSCPLTIPKGLDRMGSTGKAFALITAWISRYPTEAASFGLASDLNYVGQNGGRLLRAAWEMARAQGWARAARACLALAVAFERRIWPHSSPLSQALLLPDDPAGRKNKAASSIPPELLAGLLHHGRQIPTPSKLLELSPEALKTTLQTALGIRPTVLLPQHVERVVSLAKALPTCCLASKPRSFPVSSAGQRIVIDLRFNWQWDPRLHQGSQLFHAWLESGDGEALVSREAITEISVAPEDMDRSLQVSFFLPLSVLSSGSGRMFLRLVSDHWNLPQMLFELPKFIQGKEKKEASIVDEKAVVPEDCLSLLKALGCDTTQLNLFQEACASLLLTGGLLSAPTDPDTRSLFLKLILLRNAASSVTVVGLIGIEPVLSELETTLGLDISRVTFIHPRDLVEAEIENVLVILDLDLLAAGYERSLSLVIDKIHGAGLCYAQSASPIENPRDIAKWLGLSTFRALSPEARPTPLAAQLQGYAARHHSSRMAAMQKPVYAAACNTIGSALSTKVLVWCPSRKQAALTARALIAMASNDDAPMRFVGVGFADLGLATGLLQHCLSFGIGLVHAGMETELLVHVIDLFKRGAIRVLISALDTVMDFSMQTVSADLVILQGTDTPRLDSSHHDRTVFEEAPSPLLLRALSHACASAIIMTRDNQRAFYKHMLCHAPYLESSLASPQALIKLLAAKSCSKIEDAVCLLKKASFLPMRLDSNPFAYGCEEMGAVEIDEWLWRHSESALKAIGNVRAFLGLGLEASNILADLDSSDGEAFSPQLILRLLSMSVATEMEQRRQDSLEESIICPSRQHDQQDLETFVTKSAALTPALQWLYAGKSTSEKYADCGVKMLFLFLAHMLGIRSLPSSSWKRDLKQGLPIAKVALNNLMSNVSTLEWANNLVWIYMSLNYSLLPKPVTVRQTAGDIKAIYNYTSRSLTISSTRKVFVSAAAKEKAKQSESQSAGPFDHAIVLATCHGRIVMHPRLFKLDHDFECSQKPDSISILTPAFEEFTLRI